MVEKHFPTLQQRIATEKHELMNLTSQGHIQGWTAIFERVLGIIEEALDHSRDIDEELQRRCNKIEHKIAQLEAQRDA